MEGLYMAVSLVCDPFWSCSQCGEEGRSVHGRRAGGQPRQSSGEPAGQWRWGLRHSPQGPVLYRSQMGAFVLNSVFVCLFVCFTCSLPPVDLVTYITRFQWDMAKYPIKQSLKNISEIVSKVSAMQWRGLVDLLILPMTQFAHYCNFDIRKMSVQVNSQEAYWCSSGCTSSMFLSSSASDPDWQRPEGQSVCL